MIFTLRRRRLPEEFCADLPNTRIARAGHDSEVRAVDVSRRILKLRVVEDVENSKRRSKAKFSLIVVRFNIPKSVLLNPGPWKKRRLAVPKVPKVVLSANALGRQ